MFKSALVFFFATLLVLGTTEAQGVPALGEHQGGLLAAGRQGVGAGTGQQPGVAGTKAPAAGGQTPPATMGRLGDVPVVQPSPSTPMGGNTGH